MARKKRRSRSKAELEYFQMALTLNGKAIEEGPKRKTWSTHDLRQISPLTPAQEDMFHAFYNKFDICAHGSAGTGKTFIALYLALREVIEKREQRIIIVRSAVPTREVGHLPGTLEEKVALYELPYRDMFAEIIGRHSSYDDMKHAGLVEFMTTSFIRGLTWDNAIVIVDEFQNMSLHEIDSVVTRIGTNTRLLLCGDVKNQCDLDRKQSGANNLIHLVNEMKTFSVIKFTNSDIVRSDFVKNWIIARETLNL